MATTRTGTAPAQGDEPASSDLDDGSLLVRARTDPEAFGQFYDRQYRTVLRYFLFHTGSAHLATELTAETFAQALASVERFDPSRGTGVAWLFGIATHQFRRFLRRGEVDQRHRRRLRIITPIAAVDEVERAVERADADLLTPQLAAALSGLSDVLRAAVLLRIGADLPYADVAEQLGCTEGTARVRVARGLRQLAAAMVAT